MNDLSNQFSAPPFTELGDYRVAQRASLPSNPQRLAVTYLEAAEMLGLCERTVWQLVKDGKLKACRTGRAVRIPVAELERYLLTS